MESFRRVARRLNKKAANHGMMGTEFDLETANQVWDKISYFMSPLTNHPKLKST